MGLGPFHTVSLAEALEKAEVCRVMRLKGLDPLEERLKEQQTKTIEAAEVITFEKCAETFIANHKAGWKNGKHADQWTATLQTYVYPVFKDKPVAAIDVAIGPRLNRRVQVVFQSYANELIPEDDIGYDRVRFRAITLETIVDAIREAGAVEHAQALWRRYCDFERVFHLAMAEYTRSGGPTTSAPSDAVVSAEAKPRTRRKLEVTHAG